MAEFTFQPTTESDKDEIRALNEACYRDVVVRQFGPWDAAAQREFFEKKWREKEFQKIFVEDRFVGVLDVQWHADHVCVHEIQIHPKFLGGGLGTSILENIMSEARDRGLPVRLDVLRMNRAADLYRRLGFVETGKTENHILMEFSQE